MYSRFNQGKSYEQEVRIEAGKHLLDGNLCIPEGAGSIVVFVHGSGSSRFSSRNRFVASELNKIGLATLLFDLLTQAEERVDERTAELRFNIGLLSDRVLQSTRWLKENPDTSALDIGYFGASTGAAAALVSAACLPDIVKAVVSRGGRPDLALSALSKVVCPTLLIVGQRDPQVIDLNMQAFNYLPSSTIKSIETVPGATHLFEEPGALGRVCELAGDWFGTYLQGRKHVA